jgi:hypothetical protein
VLPCGQKNVTFGQLATITLEVAPFLAYAPFPALLLFLNATWKSCSVRVFSTACDSVSITSIVWPLSFIFNRGNRKVGWVGDDSHVASGKNSLVKNEVLDGAV